MTSQPFHRRNGIQRISEAPRIIFGLLMITLLVFALVIGTTGMAVGATEPPAEDSAEAALAAITATEPESEPVAEIEKTAEVVAAEPVPLEPAATTSVPPAGDPESADVAQASPAQQFAQALSDDEGDKVVVDEAPQVVTEPSAVESTKRAALRWAVANPDGVYQSDTSFEIQGPGGTDVNDDAQWSTGLATTIADFTGQENYSGLDLDPAVGVFEVAELVPDDDATVAQSVQAEKTYRLRSAEAPEGFEVGEDAAWQLSTGAVEPKEEVDIYELAAPNALQEPGSAELLKPENPIQAEAQLIQPLGHTSTQPPYVKWEVADSNGNVAGAKFTIQGPRTNNSPNNDNQDSQWNAVSATVEDCVSALDDCVGPDLDPAPGKFLVKKFGTHEISSAQRRYRIKPLTPPNGRVFLSTEWVKVPGSGQNPSNAWPAGIWNFGVIQLKEPLQKAPVCQSGYVYSISGNGHLRQIAPNGLVTDLGTNTASGSSLNGLGIGVGGSAVYAYERTENFSGTERTASIRKYDPVAGTWSNVSSSIVAQGNRSIAGWVAGGVNLATGEYYLGGFSQTQNGGTSQDPKYDVVFRLWKFNPTNSTTSYLGHVDFGSGLTGTSNGDLAFDGQGNLFVVRGSDSVKIMTVTAATLNGTLTGGLIASSPGSDAPLTDIGSVNGVAFDSNGIAYLGNSNSLHSYEMPEWGPNGQVTSNLSAGTNDTSTDLASCTSPPTFTLSKNVVRGRVNPADQFKLAFSSNAVPQASVTTVGTEVGLQSKQLGPVPVTPGAKISFSEEFVGGPSTAQDYASRWVCRADGVQFATGTSALGSFTYPPGVANVSCEFSNAPLTAKITLRKAVIPHDLSTAAPEPGWPVGIAVEAHGPSVSPMDLSQNTGDDGAFSWELKFATENDSTDLTVNEIENPDFAFESLVCKTDSLGQDVVTETFTESTQLLTGIFPGDDVDCTFTNKELPPIGEVSLLLKKEIVDGRVHISDQFELSVSDSTGENKGTAATVGTATGTQTVFVTIAAENLVPGATYALAESGVGETDLEAYQSALTCEASNGESLVVAHTGSDGTAGTVTLPVPGRGEQIVVTCTFANSPLGKIEVKKVDEQAPESPLAGANFELWLDDGDGIFEENEDSKNTAVHETVADGLAVWDKLPWGTYFVREITAPTGYGFSDPNPRKVVLGPDTDAGLEQIIFENPRLPGSVSWQKVDASDNGVFLAGSEWNLTGPDGQAFADNPVLDCVAATDAECDGPDKNSAAGEFTVTGLDWGVYTMVEAKAPPGYELDGETIHTFPVIDSQNLAVSLESAIENLPVTPPTIPLTGGIGRDFYALLGFGVLAASAGTFVIMQRRSRRQEV